MKDTQTFTEGKIFAPLVRFALPVLFALLLQTMYGAVDVWVVGKFAQAADVSAVATGSQIMQTVTLAITGLSMGLTVMVGKKLGAGRSEEAGQIIGSGMILFTILASVLTGVMVCTAPLQAKLMQAPEKAFDKTVSYLVICSAGTVFITAYNLLGSIFRGIGDSKMPLLTVAIACVLNIAGDIILVAGFGMGAAGAAYATIFAQAVSVVLSFLIIRRKQLLFTFMKKHLIPRWKLIGEMLRLGIPIALQDLLVSVSFLVITAIVNNLGLNESAGVGVAQKLCGFIMLVPSAYMQSMSAFVAQNIGAKRPERARKALWCGIFSSLIVGVVIGYLSFFHGDVLAGLFANDSAVVTAAAEYLKAYAIDCLLTSFLFCFMGYFNGCGNTMFVMIQGIIGAFGVRLPVSWIMSKRVPVSLFHMGLATPASTIVQIILCMGFFFLMQYGKKKKAETL